MKCPHCDMPIDEHEASRCLSAWIHVDVFGYKLPDHDWHDTHCDCVQDYAYSIAAAWEVTEKLEKEDFYLSLVYKSAIFSDDLNKLGWFAQFRCVRGGTRGDHFGVSVRPSHAICRAAIKSKGE